MTHFGLRFRLHGGMGSPYSMKMRAVLRYRRIPFDWVEITRDSPLRQKHDGPNVIPILEYPDGSARVDSTPIILDLEERFVERSILPNDPAMAFLALLIEDMADEWMTKIMFHYRWYREVDQEYSSQQIIADNSPGLSGERFDAAVKMIRDRQVGRMALVGCTANNAPIIESSYLQILNILQRTSARGQYLFGTKPCIADFGIFGQFKVLSEDRTPHTIMRSEFPRVYDWLRRLDDASGVDGAFTQDGTISPAVFALLKHAGETYLPFMAANERAIEEDEQSVSVLMLGRRFEQAPFKYQRKCFDALRRRFNDLPLDAADRVRTLLRATGTEHFFP